MRGGRPAPDSRPRGPQDNGGSQQGGTPLPGEGVHFGNLWGQTGGGHHCRMWEGASKDYQCKKFPGSPVPLGGHGERVNTCL